MGILEDLENYVKMKSAGDLDKIKTALLDKLPGIQKPSITGGSKRNTKKKGGAAQPLANETKNKNKNSLEPSGSNKAMTKKNKDLLEPIGSNRVNTKILLAILVLSSLVGIKKLIPEGTNLIQVLTIFGNDGYERVMVPFMLNMDNTFTFLKTTTAPNVMEGLYTKAIGTLNGTDILADPNRFFATIGNIAKVYGWMCPLFAGILSLTYTSKDPPVSDKEAEELLRDLLKTLNEKLKGVAGYTYMKIPAGCFLMIRNQEIRSQPPKEPSGMFASQPSEPAKM